ncbi:hypothetical protein [Bacillus sp. 105MF]|uniref:hypothetical protein n=1 Tax=Bacillus sp. 105MF TaxID=1151120 RepID=UPI00037339E6|nr:hypothetical protein [Bacillus sp. 105MF]
MKFSHQNRLKVRVPIAKKNNPTEPIRTEVITLTAEDIYKIYKFMGEDILPPFLSLDHKDQRVVVKDLSFDYKGSGGFWTQVQVKFTPKNKLQQAKTMLYDTYTKKVQDKSL